MIPRHQHNSLIAAARHNPACRRASIWTIAKDESGHEIVLPDGTYKWSRLCMAWVAFSYGPADQWAGVTGDYANDYKMMVIPEAVSRAPFVLPDLGDTFMLRRYPKFAGDPTPEISLAVSRTGGTSTGIQQQFLAREPSLSDVSPEILEN